MDYEKIKEIIDQNNATDAEIFELEMQVDRFKRDGYIDFEETTIYSSNSLFSSIIYCIKNKISELKDVKQININYIQDNINDK